MNELPLELQMIINEYAKPITRPDWKANYPNHGQVMIQFKNIIENYREIKSNLRLVKKYGGRNYSGNSISIFDFIENYNNGEYYDYGKY